MANIASSKKDARRSAVRAAKNRSVRSAVKTKVTKFRRGLQEGDTEHIEQLVATAISALDRAAAKGILHKNNAARRKSRIMKGLQAAAPAAAADQAAEAAPPKKTRGTRATPASTKTSAKAPAATARKAAPKKPAKK